MQLYFINATASGFYTDSLIFRLNINYNVIIKITRNKRFILFKPKVYGLAGINISRNIARLLDLYVL